ncbi:UDP-N-acetylmuramate--L-alanine ligase [Anditalea andensis]|uniref:UDP-N-acetylmuramate--L-alanine ligase n=1 Tax=Anditalea andensis TaxID=1048983 RepID=A0A074KYR4_9BACT|nr:UDP-N-acetylmuramate--L-alanine ligase [Anditalea andensis]KEO75096.1 UDP-N-acetylmuramate--alanine ligase [Anditalea andensis]
MNLKNLHNVYFLGIGGIGMSAIARWFGHVGIPVKGYDKTPSPLTQQLVEEGIYVHYEDTLDTIPTEVKGHKSHTLIVWTPAMPADSVQLDYFRREGYLLKKRAEVLGSITKDMFTIAVAGTHGKTSTSSIISHLLKSAGMNVTAFLGGITQNYESNLILHDESRDEAPIVVVEADEYDRSFLQLHPNIAVVTSVDPDHLDIYGDHQELTRNFNAFIDLIHPEGHLLIQKNAFSALNRNNFGFSRVESYSLTSSSIHATNIRSGIRSFAFDYVKEDQFITDLTIHVPGFHNVENALAAVTVALDLGIKESDIRDGLDSYKGVKRRFEIKHQHHDRVYIDDYAHHPEEIKAFLGSVKAMYPDKKLTAVFQPHLFTRTRDFAREFSSSLSLADEVVLMEIYPAREKPIEGVNAAMLLGEITAVKKSVQKREDLMAYLETASPEVLVTIGAGDIDRMVEPITKWIKGYGN